MVGKVTGENNISILVEHIHLEEIQNKTHVYFGLLGIGNAVAPLPSTLAVSDLINLSDGHGTQSTEIIFL